MKILGILKPIDRIKLLMHIVSLWIMAKIWKFTDSEESQKKKKKKKKKEKNVIFFFQRLLLLSFMKFLNRNENKIEI